MLEKLLKALKDAGLEVSDELKGQLKTLAEEGGKFTQDDVDSIVKSRLEREKKNYESQIQTLENDLKGRVTPEEYNQLKGQLEETQKAHNEQIESLKVETALRGLAAGAHDVDAFLLKVKAKGYQGKLDSSGNLIVVDGQGNPVQREGKFLDSAGLVEEIKSENAWLYPVDDDDQQQFKKNFGASNPGGKGKEFKNPWAKDTFNMTEQVKIMRENPELAIKLQSQVK